MLPLPASAGTRKASHKLLARPGARWAAAAAAAVTRTSVVVVTAKSRGGAAGWETMQKAAWCPGEWHAR